MSDTGRNASGDLVFYGGERELFRMKSDVLTNDIRFLNPPEGRMIRIKVSRRVAQRRKWHAMRARRMRHDRLQALHKQMEADWATLMTPGEDA
jgi:hypothetical protein